MASVLDVLNELYVATTRASSQLYLHCAYPEAKDLKKNSDEINDIAVWDVISRVLSGGESEMEVYEVGEPSVASHSEKLGELDVKIVELKRDQELQPTEEELAKRAELRYTYSDDTEDVRRYGILMHKLFERIVELDDVARAIEWLEREGEDVGELRSEVDEIIAIDGVAEFFDSKWRVMNEAEIFDGANGRVYRPDRVMIDGEKNEVIVVDYKFGEYTDELHQKYSRQVGCYVRLIKEMGYDARGYILYAKERKLIQI